MSSRAFRRVGNMDAPLGYEEMRVVFVWGARSLMHEYRNEQSLPEHYRYAGEYIGRLLTMVDAFEAESPDAVTATVRTISTIAWLSMRRAYEDDIGRHELETTMAAMSGMYTGQQHVETAYVDYLQYAGCARYLEHGR